MPPKDSTPSLHTGPDIPSDRELSIRPPGRRAALIMHLRRGQKANRRSARMIRKVALIDADSGRMTEVQLMPLPPTPPTLAPLPSPPPAPPALPKPKGGLVLRASGAVGLLLTPGSRGCCGESGSLSQCIRHDRHARRVLRGTAE